MRENNQKRDSSKTFAALLLFGKGAFKIGRPLSLAELKKVKVDLVVASRVAVNRKGGRVGKAGGYSDREYAILKELVTKKDVEEMPTPNELKKC